MSTNAPQPVPSPRRLAANRANACRSTGPRTEAGKRVSSQNARKEPACPISHDLPRPFALEWFQEALRRTASCPTEQARVLLINRCMLQAHEIRWRALERTLFDTACAETGGDREEAARFVAHQPSFVKALKTYYHWIARRVLHVERQLAAIAGSAAAPATEVVKVMAAGASFDATTVQPDGSFVISWNRTHLGDLLNQTGGAWRPVPPVPAVSAVGPVRPVPPIRGRYRLYPHCPSGPLESPNRPRPLADPSPAVQPHRQPDTRSIHQIEAEPSAKLREARSRLDAQPAARIPVQPAEKQTQLPIVNREGRTAGWDSVQTDSVLTAQIQEWDRRPASNPEPNPAPLRAIEPKAELSGHHPQDEREQKEPAPACRGAPAAIEPKRQTPGPRGPPNQPESRQTPVPEPQATGYGPTKLQSRSLRRRANRESSSKPSEAL